MTTRHFAIWVGTLAALAAVAIATAAEPGPAETPCSNTSEATCLIKIVSDPATFPLDPRSPALELLLLSDPVRSQAARAVFGQEDASQAEIRLEILDTTQPPPMGEPPRATGMRHPGMGAYGEANAPGGGPAGMMMAGGMMGGGFGEAHPPDSRLIGAPIPAQQTLIAKLEVQLPDNVRPAAQEFMMALCERLQVALTTSQKSSLAPIVAQLEAVKQQVEEAKARLLDLQRDRQRLCEEAGTYDLTRDVILGRAQELEHQQRQLDMELAAQQARRNAIEQQIARIGKKAEDKTAEDPLIKPLEMRLDLTRKQLQNAQERHEAGVSPQMEIEQARVQMAEIQAQIAQRRIDMRETTGARQLTELSAQLVTLSIDAAEREAQLRFLNEQLAKTRELLNLAEAYESEVATELPPAREAYERARRHRDIIEQQRSFTQAPTVTVLGSE